jgi:hypothetical protein
MDVEVVGIGGEGDGEGFDAFGGKAGGDIVGGLEFAAFLSVPVGGEAGELRLVIGFGCGLLVVE